MDLAEHRWRDDQGPFGGAAAGPNPTDRGKLGTKRSVLTEGHGLPIAIVVAQANRFRKILVRFEKLQPTHLSLL